MWKFGLIGIVLAILLISLSCSGSGITTPEGEDTAWLEKAKATDDAGKHILWGLWQFSGDLRTGKLDVFPVRHGMAHLNALVFLEPPANKLLKIGKLTINGDIIDVDVSLTHPFPGQSKFTGFDVKGILITKANDARYPGPITVLPNEDVSHLMNPDGMTIWWGPYLYPPNDTWPNQGYIDGLLGTPQEIAKYAGNVNGYKYFCDSLGPDDDISQIDVTKRGMFSTGKTNTRHYRIKVIGGTFVFNYAVDANWAWPKHIPPLKVPEDFPLEANQPEAYRVEVQEFKNTLYYDGYFGGGDLILDVTVYTWRDPSTTLGVFIESPEVFTECFSKTPVEVGDGWARYRVEATTCTCRKQGQLFVLIGVQTTLAEVEQYGGFFLTPLTAYFPYHATVGSIPPTDGIPGTPRGLHMGEEKQLPIPPGFNMLLYKNVWRPAVRGNHVAIPIAIGGYEKFALCVYESFDGGQTFTPVPFVEGEESKLAGFLDDAHVAIDSHDGIHFVAQGDDLDKSVLTYCYKSFGSAPDDPIYPLGTDSKPPPWEYQVFPLLDGDDVLHIVYRRVDPVNDPDVERIFEITTADYINFSEPIEYCAKPNDDPPNGQHIFGDDILHYAMSSDGELYVVIGLDLDLGTGYDIYFTHGFPGNMSEWVKLNNDDEPYSQFYPSIMVYGKDCYITWYTEFLWNEPGWWTYFDYDSCPSEGVCINSTYEISQHYELGYRSTAPYVKLVPNSWNVPVFAEEIWSSGAPVSSSHLYAYYHKVGTLSCPIGPKENFIPYLTMVAPQLRGGSLIVSSSGIVVVETIIKSDTQCSYSYSPLDLY